MTGEVQVLLNIQIPAQSYHEEGLAPPSDLFNSAKKIIHQNDIRVDVTKQAVRSQILGFFEKVTNKRCTVLITVDVRHVSQAQLSAHFSGAIFLTKEDYFRLRTKKRPARYGVTLDY